MEPRGAASASGHCGRSRVVLIAERAPSANAPTPSDSCRSIKGRHVSTASSRWVSATSGCDRRVRRALSYERNHKISEHLDHGRAAERYAGRVYRRPRLGGLLNYYGRAATLWLQPRNGTARALPARHHGVRRALSSRAESSGSRQSTHRGHAGDRQDGPRAVPPAAWRAAQLL